MVIYDARTHTVTTIDGRETCPQTCTKTLFVNPRTHKPMDYETASDQPLSTGVPSMVATWALAIKRFGRGSLKTDLRPAISIADHGFAVNRDFRQLTESGLQLIRAYPASRRLFLTPTGNPLPLGHVLRNPEIAHTSGGPRRLLPSTSRPRDWPMPTAIAMSGTRASRACRSGSCSPRPLPTRGAA